MSHTAPSAQPSDPAQQQAADAARGWRLSDFDYELPPELIAQSPPPARSDGRLLVLPQAAPLVDAMVRELPSWLEPGDLLVFNNTRVMKARVLGRKASGGRVEVLVERVLDDHRVLAMVRASKTPRPGSELWLHGHAPAVNDTANPAPDPTTNTLPPTAAAKPLRVQVLGRVDEFFELRWPCEPAAWLREHGALPLPPYIQRAPDAQDEGRYQTMLARHEGAVAAPTAGLHFDAPLMQTLQARGVQMAELTLHVGAGTFAPVRHEALHEHRMHAERFHIDTTLREAIAQTRARGGRVVAVGTTTLRALEAAAQADPQGLPVVGADETRLFITPGFRFQVVDLLLTNFHLPRSTLLVLVSAFAGYDRMRAAYQHAVAERYRFFSYGDACLLTRERQIQS